MALQEIEFASRNGRDTIQAWLYEPAADPVAVVQIVHGLGEHSRRYIHLISALLDAGFVVVADDHAGHGRTAMRSGTWADAGDDAARVVVDDEITLQDKVRELYPELALVVFGHSWGSMIARVMATDSRARIDGLALCGIAAQMRGLETSLDRDALALALQADPTAQAPDALVQQMFDGFADRLRPDAGATDWIARDPHVVADHARDPFNNFGAPMSTRFLQGFADAYDQANAESFYDGLPDIPVLVLAGEEDPVTNFGAGARHVAERLQALGRDVELRTYPGLRHEVHNEPESRLDVEAALVAFVQKVARRRDAH